jgi:hypothetical protein
MDSILSQMNPFHILRSCVFNDYFDIFTSTPGSSKCLFSPSRFTSEVQDRYTCLVISVRIDIK